MALLNTANKLYIGSTPATAAYKNGIKVWPPLVNSLAATIAEIAVAVATAPWYQITTVYGGVVPGSYKFYSKTGSASWVLRHTGAQGPHNFDTLYSSTFVMKVEAFTGADGTGLLLGTTTTNTVDTPAKPVTQVQRVWSGTAVDTTTYNGSNGVRTDGPERCYYGYFGSTQGLQKSQARWDIPSEIRNCVSVDKVRMRWWNVWHYWNSGGRVSMVGHHNTNLNTYGGSTGVLLSGGAQATWLAPKPGWINGTEWYDLAGLTSSGRPSIAEEIRVQGLQGFGLVTAASGQGGYGYASTDPVLEITYTVRM